MKLKNIMLLAAGIIGLLATGCKSDDYDDGSTPLDNAAYIDAAEVAPETRVTFKKTVETLDRTFAVKLISPAPADMATTLAVDAAALASYNRRHETNYTILPEKYYELSTMNPAISAGKSVSETVTIHFKGLDELEIDQTHLLPISLTGTSSGLGLLRGSETLYYLVRRSSAITTAADLTGSYMWIPGFETDEGRQAVNGLTALTFEAIVNINEFASDSEISTIMGVEQHCLLRLGDTGFPRQQLQTQIGGKSGCKFPEADASKSLQPGEWYHIAMTWDLQTTELKFYVNGQLQSSGNAIYATEDGAGSIDLAQPSPTAYRFFIGYSYAPGRLLNGLISQVRVWSVARSQEDIFRDMYDVDAPETKPELRAWWKFDEGTGNTVKDWSQYCNDAVCLTGTNNFEGGERTEGTLKWNNSIEIPQLNQEQ